MTDVEKIVFLLIILFVGLSVQAACKSWIREAILHNTIDGKEIKDV